jgi:hypothetical protein
VCRTELSIRASLEREESRGYYLRPDYPEIDDANWAYQLACRLQNDEFVFEKRELPKVDWDSVNWDEVKPERWFYKGLEEPVAYREEGL